MGCYQTCTERMAAFDEDIPDIPDAFECDQWNAVMVEASATFDQLFAKLDLLISELDNA